jgi:transposase
MCTGLGDRVRGSAGPNRTRAKRDQDVSHHHSARLAILRDWLASHEVTLAGMEFTWCYDDSLLGDDLQCRLLDAQHLGAPGRRTDVDDAAWIAHLIRHGLTRPTFVPPRPIRGTDPLPS